jgi:hypothetical protein
VGLTDSCPDSVRATCTHHHETLSCCACSTCIHDYGGILLHTVLMHQSSHMPPSCSCWLASHVLHVSSSLLYCTATYRSQAPPPAHHLSWDLHLPDAPPTWPPGTRALPHRAQRPRALTAPGGGRVGDMGKAQACAASSPAMWMTQSFIARAVFNQHSPPCHRSQYLVCC